MKVTTIKSARVGSTTVHLGEDIGWGSRPFCPALRTGRREVDPHAEGTANCRPCIREANRRYLDVDHLIQISSRVRNLIKAVREYAVANYNTGAWDIIVEAYTDPELAETVKTCRTAAGAIRKVAKIVELYRERRAPHDAEIAAATEPARCTPTDECEECESGSVCAARCAHCGGTNSTPCPRHDLESDGSIVTARHAYDGELVSLTRTWPGKVGSANILVDWYGDGDAPESYTPGWRGMTIDSNFCDFDASVPF